MHEVHVVEVVIQFIQGDVQGRHVFYWLTYLPGKHDVQLVADKGVEQF